MTLLLKKISMPLAPFALEVNVEIRGRVTASGVFVASRLRGIGYVPQDLALFPHLSVRQNLLYGHKPGNGGQVSFTFERVVEVLEIQPLVQRRVTELSGGEQQRVAIARALLS